MAARPNPRPGVRRRPESASRLTYFLGEGVFVAPVTSRPGQGRRIASLSEYLRLLLARRPSPGAPVGGVLGEAWTHARHLQVLRFCLDELAPHLRSFGGASGGRHDGMLPLPPRTFERLDGWAQELLRSVDGSLPPPGSLEGIDALLTVPSVLSGGMLIPLSPVAAASPADLPIALGDRLYIPCGKEARPFEEVLREVRREQERWVQRSIRARRALTRTAWQFLEEVKSILERCAPRDCGRYQLFYRDREHQLQHSRGHWILVRGPLTRRVDGQALFAGLRLAGRTRRDWLGVAPHPGVQQGQFWAPDGNPLQGGVCMGDPGQYSRLLSPQFTDAGAVVEWLDAGVILLTGRSALHRRLREPREERLPRQSIVLPRGSRRRC